MTNDLYDPAIVRFARARLVARADGRVNLESALVAFAEFSASGLPRRVVSDQLIAMARRLGGGFDDGVLTGLAWTENLFVLDKRCKGVGR
ncbi:hypothetical protein [Jiella marina]|uniref:hypothetical protein n=1 Tax=Jiella sp. LLJ827 TaxID=2917712 RepID=UPI0021019DBF|nr:hypothetical protein [Jiella sp. LLJ827]MCQ0987531.1 hypothetical protein [Jiella sp. LLJ827]